MFEEAESKIDEAKEDLELILEDILTLKKELESRDSDLTTDYLQPIILSLGDTITKLQ